MYIEALLEVIQLSRQFLLPEPSIDVTGVPQISNNPFK